MKMIIETYIDTKILSAKVSGQFSLNEAKNLFLEMLKDIERYQVNKVLFDGREIVGKPTVIERFYYGDFVANAVINRQPLKFILFAYVLQIPVLDPNRFGETVARNRGMQVKTFDNVEDALQYLGALKV